jgi:carbon-monoxide dehydrogenase medium subunit
VRRERSEGLALKRFEYYAPDSLSQAITLLREKGDGGRLLAGGTDLLVQMKEAGLHPSYVVSVRKLPELRGIQFSETDGLRIGAMTDMAEIEEHPLIRDRYQALSDGARVLGSVQTRNMATVGGNVCNAAPSADTAPPLLALDARVEITGPEGSRLLPLRELFRGPGETALGPTDILVSITMPAPPPHTGSVYERHTPRAAMDIAVVGVAALVTLDDRQRIKEGRIALGAVAPTPIRAPEAEQTLAGQPPTDEVIARAAALAVEAARPISDLRGSAAYRRHLVGVMTERCLRIAIERARD